MVFNLPSKMLRQTRRFGLPWLPSGKSDCRQASFSDACIGNQGRGHHVGDTLSGTPCSGLALGLNTIYCQQVRLMGNLFHNRYFFRDNLNEIDGFSHCIITFGNDYLSIFSNSSSLIKILPLAISEIFSTVLWSGIWILFFQYQKRTINKTKDKGAPTKYVQVRICQLKMRVNT